VDESGSNKTLQISEPWYPFALMGIHVTRAILETLTAGLLQRNIIMKVNGNVIESVSRICQNLYGFVERSSTLMIDQLVEEFHIYWVDLVRQGDVKSVLDFERVYNEFKRSKGML